MTSAERALILTTAVSVKLLCQRMGLHTDILIPLTHAIEAATEMDANKEKSE